MAVEWNFLASRRSGELKQQKTNRFVLLINTFNETVNHQPVKLTNESFHRKKLF